MESEILTLEEVAQYLRVSERTVYDWAQRGEIPAGKLGTSWRFKRSEIEAWVDRKLSGRKPLDDSHTVDLKRVLSPDRVITVESASKADALNELVACLARAPQVKNEEDLREGIFRREELMSTGIGGGIAIPHVRLDSVKDLAVA
ncbi:MAG: helix-turn-helix domain-containing protein, partial [Spirochaetia bacterium]